MDLSIIIPVYNRLDEVRDLLDSLSKQTDKDFEVVLVGLNLAFYYVDDGRFYGIHNESIPIKVKILPRDTPESPYINTQCSGDTHVDGEVIFSCRDPKELWDGVRIGGKPLGEVLSRSYIITLN